MGIAAISAEGSHRFFDTTAAGPFTSKVVGLSSERPVVRFNSATSNTFFEVLADWETYLKAENIDIHKLEETKPRTPRLRGPSL